MYLRPYKPPHEPPHKPPHEPPHKCAQKKSALHLLICICSSARLFLQVEP